MRMIRAKVEPGFIAVPNEAEDADLSSKALGLLTRWLRTPHGEEITPIKDMVASRKKRGSKRIEGRDSHYSASYELEAEGFLVRRLEPCDGGHEWIAYVYAHPLPPGERSDPAGRERPGTKRAAKREAKSATGTTGRQSDSRKPENQELGPTCNDADPRKPENQDLRKPENQELKTRLPLLDTSEQTEDPPVVPPAADGGGADDGGDGGPDAAASATQETQPDSGQHEEQSPAGRRKRTRTDNDVAALTAARERQAAKEREAQQPTLPEPGNAFPPVEFSDGRWRRSDGPRGRSADDSASGGQRGAQTGAQRSKSRLHELPEDYQAPDGLLDKMARMYPSIDVGKQHRKFRLHYWSNGQRRKNWNYEFEKWCDNAVDYEERDRQRDQQRQQQGAPTHADGSVMMHPDGSSLVGTDRKFAQAFAAGERVMARHQAGGGFGALLPQLPAGEQPE